MEEKPVLHLVDGSGYIFRAYFAIRPLSMRDGTPTHAVLGFAKMLLKLLRQRKPQLLGMAFDTGQKNFRHTIYKEYKANRDEPPEDLLPQFSLIHQLVDAMQIPKLMLDGYEADDVLATLAKKAIAQGHDVVLVTGDKDLMQLVDDHLTIFDPLKDCSFDIAGVIERFGVAPKHVVDILGLAGDSSDNIPGVPRVGPKSAAKLVQTFGDTEAIIRGLTKQTKRKAFEQAVLDHQEDARLSKRLATLALDAPIDLVLETLVYRPPEQATLKDFLTRIEAYGLLRDFGLDKLAPHEPVQQVRPNQTQATPAPQAAQQPQQLKKPDAASGDTTDILIDFLRQGMPEKKSKTASDDDVWTHRPQTTQLFFGPSPYRAVDTSHYQTILDVDALQRVALHIKKVGVVSVDTETSSLNANQAELVGISLCSPGHQAVYLPLTHHYLGAPKQLSLSVVRPILAPLFADADIIKVGQHLKYDGIVLARAGLALVGIKHDAMLAAYVLDAARPSFGLDALAREVLGHKNISYDEATGTGKNRKPFYEVDIEQATAYAAEDADVALRICQALNLKLNGQAVQKIYRDIEIPLVDVLLGMEQHGVRVDITHLKALGDEFAERLKTLEDQAFEVIGRPINLGSPRQLSHLFFEELKYPSARKTQTGYSTDQEVLETLARQYPLARTVLDHRLLTKLKSTYVDALPRMVNPQTQRVHTSYNQTGTATGRLSSSDPNLQNIPIRGEDGKRIRAAFVAEPGHVLVSADYSQIELRVMAHLSGDAAFVEAFRQGEDIHRRTAKEILAHGQEPTPEMRRQAKAINFGILYGLSEYGLARQLNIPRTEAAAYIRAYFGRYPSIRGFLDRTIEKGREDGFVSTLCGRRRALPNLRSQNGTLRQGAERIAMNTPIQGTAADIIKIAMLKVAARLKAEKSSSKLLLQVHDELVLEVPHTGVETTTRLVRDEMQNAIALTVPLVVDVGVGHSWAEAH